MTAEQEEHSTPAYDLEQGDELGGGSPASYAIRYRKTSDAGAGINALSHNNEKLRFGFGVKSFLPVFSSS